MTEVANQCWDPV